MTLLPSPHQRATKVPLSEEDTISGRRVPESAIWQALHPQQPHRAFRPCERRLGGQPLPLRCRWKRQTLRRSSARAARQSRHVAVGMLLGVVVPVVLSIVIVAGLLVTAWLYYLSQAPTLARLASHATGDNLKIYDAQGNLIYELADQGVQTSVKLNQIAPDVQQATVAVEDKDFWTNQGVDFLAVVRAASLDLRSGHVVAGGSTITQQLLKNVLLGPQVTFDRKLREMILALGLTHQISKADILNLYLNTIYYGEQAYGIDAAAHTYFGLLDAPGHPAASQLDLAQAALLAGLPKSPSTLDPYLNPAGALDRQQVVLNQLVVERYITQKQAAAAEEEAARPGFFTSSKLPNLAPHFARYVLRELQMLMDSGAIPASALSRSGLSIKTTLNLSLQNQIPVLC